MQYYTLPQQRHVSSHTKCWVTRCSNTPVLIKTYIYAYWVQACLKWDQIQPWLVPFWWQNRFVKAPPSLYVWIVGWGKVLPLSTQLNSLESCGWPMVKVLDHKILCSYLTSCRDCVLNSLVRSCVIHDQQRFIYLLGSNSKLESFSLCFSEVTFSHWSCQGIQSSGPLGFPYQVY